ncbi:death-associated protein 1 [Nilaparvata lugens]|uniref:Death-associated protein-1 n=1 Tax=Nilaparvata lugens TaxID=108931 RepID=A0AAU7BNE0_NILLU|nr:death-associated protein 1 [Nilaparvata lugens]
MSSPGKEELKAGHPPAVKAGGMRITQHKSPKSGEKPVFEEGEINNAGLNVATCPPKTVSISGAPVRGNADFPPEAVQSFHEKPVDNKPIHCATKPHNIQQPRKM